LQQKQILTKTIDAIRDLRITYSLPSRAEITYRHAIPVMPLWKYTMSHEQRTQRGRGKGPLRADPTTLYLVHARIYYIIKGKAQVMIRLPESKLTFHPATHRPSLHRLDIETQKAILVQRNPFQSRKI